MNPGFLVIREPRLLSAPLPASLLHLLTSERLLDERQWRTAIWIFTHATDTRTTARPCHRRRALRGFEAWGTGRETPLPGEKMPHASEWAYIRRAGEARFAAHHASDECSRIVHGQFAAANDHRAFEVSLCKANSRNRAV